jgi:hypothetical protein
VGGGEDGEVRAARVGVQRCRVAGAAGLAGVMVVVVLWVGGVGGVGGLLEGEPNFWAGGIGGCAAGTAGGGVGGALEHVRNAGSA